MTAEQVSDTELRRVFEEFDESGDGHIGEGEFRKVLNALGEEPSDAVLSLEFAAIDTNGDGKVEFEEFRLWWTDGQ
jgi:Ca2+-binding EF-hand superfamily protein